ncbi:MAG: DUF2442 domain-containing protein [Cyanobacteria bacterium P01_H01_bin.152]
MTSSTVEVLNLPQISDVTVSEEFLTVTLSDGRVISVSVVWYPRLMQGTMAERNHWRLIAAGQGGIHWPELDEDISLKNILLGQPSNESQTSLQKWLESRHH